MSKLDTVLTSFSAYHSATLKDKNIQVAQDKAKQEIKALMLELIDGANDLGEYEDWGTFTEGFSDCQQQLREKVEAL